MARQKAEAEQKQRLEEIRLENAKLEQARIRLAEENARESKRQSISLSISQLQQQKDLLSQKMAGKQSKISDLEIQRNQLESELMVYKSKVANFMMEHKMAITCMGAVGASLDNSNEYSRDAKDLAAAGALVCGIAILANDEFRQEVFYVVEQLNKADGYTKNYKLQISNLQSQINIESSSLERDKSEISKITSDIQSYKYQLDSDSKDGTKPKV